jgi:hypothetical protein
MRWNAISPSTPLGTLSEVETASAFGSWFLWEGLYAPTDRPAAEGVSFSGLCPRPSDLCHLFRSNRGRERQRVDEFPANERESTRIQNHFSPPMDAD